MTHGGLYGKIFIAQWKQKMNRLYKSGRFWDGNDAGVGTMDHIKIFFVFIGAGVESLAECKIQEKKGQKIFWFLFGIIMIVAPTIWMVSQIREFLEVI